MKTINFNDSYLDGIETGWRYGSEEAQRGDPYNNNPQPTEETSPFYRGYFEGYDAGYTAETEKWNETNRMVAL